MELDIRTTAWYRLRGVPGLARDDAEARVREHFADRGIAPAALAVAARVYVHGCAAAAPLTPDETEPLIADLVRAVERDANALIPALELAEVLYKVITNRHRGVQSFAARLLDRLGARWPDHPLVLWGRARHCLYFGRFVRALRLLDALAAQYPGDAEIAAAAAEAREGQALAARPPHCRFSMIVLTYGNHADILEACLAGIRRRCRLPAPEIEVIVGINGSTDASEAIALAHGARVVRRERNEGLDLYKPLFAMAEGEYLVDVDDDVIDFPDAFDTGLLAHFAAYPDYGFLGLGMEENAFLAHKMPPAERYVPDRRGELCVWEGPVGGWCAAISRRDYFAINGFNGVRLADENGRLLVGEEPQIWKKLSERGRRFGVLPGLRCLHGVKSMAAWREWLAQHGGAPDAAASPSSSSRPD